MENRPGLRSTSGLRVRFVDGSRGGLSLLEIEVPRSQRSLVDVHQALNAMGIEFSNVEVQVGPDSVLERLGLTDRGGGPISPGRHLEIQTTVLEVMQARLLESLPAARFARFDQVTMPTQAAI
jgi:hypothetical protein